MNHLESAPLMGNVQQVLISAIAHRIEHMSQEDLQSLVAQADVALRNEVAALQERVRLLEVYAIQQRTEYEKALCKLTRDFVKEKDWDDFDPNEYTVSAADLRAVIDGVATDAGRRHERIPHSLVRQIQGGATSNTWHYWVAGSFSRFGIGMPPCTLPVPYANLSATCGSFVGWARQDQGSGAVEIDWRCVTCLERVASGHTFCFIRLEFGQ